MKKMDIPVFLNLKNECVTEKKSFCTDVIMLPDG